MKISARNVLKGKVKKTKQGTVNTEVTIEVSKGLNIVAIITKESAKNLVLKKGKAVYAVIKASNVIVATD
jgi:molybdopterin-binding protein